MSRYHEVYASWQANPEAFWAEAARDISWYKPWDRVFDPYMGEYGRWFAGAACNTAYNCLDRHVERGRGDQTALIYDSAVTGTTRTFTYAELTHEVATIAGILHDLGVRKGPALGPSDGIPGIRTNGAIENQQTGTDPLHIERRARTQGLR